MALYSKQLHVRKAGVVIDINLYTTLSEAGNSALAIKDGETTVYAKLGATTDALTSPLRVRKNGEIRAVLTQAKPSYTEVAYTTVGTYMFVVPDNVTRVRVAVCGGGGIYFEEVAADLGGIYSGTSTFGNFISATGGESGGLYWLDQGGWEYYGKNGSPNGYRGGWQLGFDSIKLSSGYGSPSSEFSGGGGYNTGYFTVTPGQSISLKVGNGNGGDPHSWYNGKSGFVLVAYGGDI